MAAQLDDPAVVEYGDVVAELAGGQPVADIDRGLVAHDPVEVLVDLHLRHRIQGGGGLVQDHKGGVLVQGPGQGDLLGLAAGDLDPRLVELLVEGRFQALGEGRKAFPEPGQVQTGGGPAAVVPEGGGHVLAQGEGQQLEVLEHHREQGQVVPVVVLADVDAV